MMKVKYLSREIRKKHVLYCCKLEINMLMISVNSCLMAPSSRANQWTGYYMIGTSVKKELKHSSLYRNCLCSETTCNIISPLYFFLALFPSCILQPVCYCASIFTDIVFKKLKKENYHNIIQTYYSLKSNSLPLIFSFACNVDFVI